MRTDDEKLAFAKECLRIEKKGGDVQGYIRDNWPSYTPRGTWYNLQREYLGRKPHQLTEGRPRKIEKEETEVKRHGDAVEMAMSVIQCHKNGGNVRQFILEHGYGDPAKWLCNIKFRFKTDHPEIYAELKDITLGRGPRTKAEEPNPAQEEKKPSENPGKKAKGAETVVIKDGKEYVKMEGTGRLFRNAADQDIYGKHPVTAYIEKKPSPTCCQPARPSGVSVPDEDVEPETSSALKINSVKSRLGVYSLSNVSGAMSFRMNQNGVESELTMTVQDWKIFTVEILMALEQLGLLKLGK
jgi:hypothetical protein